MHTIELFERLRSALARSDRAVSAVGIDLGTTKSCGAVAGFNPDTGEITCECVTYPEPGVPGTPVAVPSVVAVKDGATLVGHAARRLVGNKGFIPQRDYFRETKNEIGLRYTYWKAPKVFVRV
jgi:molecular chaperone DnaK (HSP70)